MANGCPRASIAVASYAERSDHKGGSLTYVLYRGLPHLEKSVIRPMFIGLTCGESMPIIEMTAPHPLSPVFAKDFVNYQGIVEFVNAPPAKTWFLIGELVVGRKGWVNGLD